MERRRCVLCSELSRSEGAASVCSEISLLSEPQSDINQTHFNMVTDTLGHRGILLTLKRFAGCSQKNTFQDCLWTRMSVSDSVPPVLHPGPWTTFHPLQSDIAYIYAHYSARVIFATCPAFFCLISWQQPCLSRTHLHCLPQGKSSHPSVPGLNFYLPGLLATQTSTYRSIYRPKRLHT